MNQTRAIRALWVAVSLAIVSAGSTALAQDVVTRREIVDFDRPEAWAMKYFGAATLLTGVGAPHSEPAGSIAFELEAVNLPHLSAEKRTVGFTGTKPEDLNKIPVYLRPRLSVGLPAGFSLTLSYVPPVTIRGLRPSLASVAVGRPLFSGDGWGVGARVYGQRGNVRSDFTCPKEEASFPPGSPQNLYGCEDASRDVATLRYAGLEVIGSKQLQSRGGPELHLGVSGNYFDNEFQVDARTYGFIDRTHLLTHGMVYTIEGGVNWQLSGRYSVGTEVFYAPLSVVRPGEGRTNDPLLNARFVLQYRLR